MALNILSIENVQAPESRIRDADMAEEMSHFVRDQILTQSSTAMLAQANTKSQTIDGGGKPPSNRMALF